MPNDGSADPAAEKGGPPDRRARQLARQRHDILEAAARAFVRAGYQATTMRAIAHEAGFKASSLYTYFSSKEEIFGALVEELLTDLFGTFHVPCPAGLAFHQRLELLLIRQGQFMERNADAFGFLAQATACGDAPDALKQHEEGHELYIEHLSTWFEENATQADLGGRPPEEAAYFLWGVQHAFFLRETRRGTTTFVAAVPTLLALFLHGVTG